MNYESFIEKKSLTSSRSGVAVARDELHPRLYAFQNDLVRQALARGRSALFTDTGTGKTAMQIEWARIVSQRIGRVLILCPLAVAEQTVKEGQKFDVEIKYLREDDGKSPIVITNYEMMEYFLDGGFSGIVLDESSILKSFSGKIRTAIINGWLATPMKLACTATPAPNDFMELGNHSEFLGDKSRTEMLAEFFVHDGGSTSDWRLKGHAREGFWRWICGWAALMRRPSDMGYSDDGFILPELRQELNIIELDHVEARAKGLLFVPESMTLNEQRSARRSTISARVERAAELAQGDEPVIIWCELNAEADAVTAAVSGAMQVAGSDSLADKVDRLLGFAEGRYRVLVTKPSIAGFGMNWQHCNRMIFMGVSHSFEMTYQAIRRCWRYGQKKPVSVHFICSGADGKIIDNYRRKEAEHRAMSENMVNFANQYTTGPRWNIYNATRQVEVPIWLMQ